VPMTEGEDTKPVTSKPKLMQMNKQTKRENPSKAQKKEKCWGVKPAGACLPFSESDGGNKPPNSWTERGRRGSGLGRGGSK